MSVSEPVLKMAELIENGGASFGIREGVPELVYISFKNVLHPEIWVSPRYRETNQEWMTKTEKEFLCQKVLKLQCELEERQNTQQRNKWKRWLGVP